MGRKEQADKQIVFSKMEKLFSKGMRGVTRQAGGSGLLSYGCGVASGGMRVPMTLRCVSLGGLMGKKESLSCSSLPLSLATSLFFSTSSVLTHPQCRLPMGSPLGVTTGAGSGAYLLRGLDGTRGKRNGWSSLWPPLTASRVASSSWSFCSPVGVLSAPARAYGSFARHATVSLFPLAPPSCHMAVRRNTVRYFSQTAMQAVWASTLPGGYAGRPTSLLRGRRDPEREWLNSGLAFSHSTAVSGSPLIVAQRFFFGGKKSGTTSQKEKAIERVEKDEEEDGEDGGAGDGDPNCGYLPFRAPFHTFNIVMLLFLGNVICYLLMRFGDDRVKDFMVEHFTVSRANWSRIYPLFTNAFFQENLLQLLIDCWLLSSIGSSLLNFIGNARLAWLCMLCVLGGSLFHLAKQQYFLYKGEDELLVRGRVYGSNTFIMGLISLDGLIFRHLTFVQEPPIPYLVLTAFVMALDVWRIATVMPEEHGAATGGAIMALIFWALPIRLFGMDKLTAMI